MRRIYIITFWCCLGVVCFGMPRRCHASQTPLHNLITKQYFPLFQEAIKVYVKRSPPADPLHLEMCKQIQSCIEISPQAYAAMTLFYVRYYFDQVQNKTFPKALITLIYSYIKKKEEEAYYQQRKMEILKWASQGHKWPFSIAYLAYEMKFRRLYDVAGDHLKRALKDNIALFKQKRRWIYIYTWDSACLAANVYVWLIEAHQWPSPTDEQRIALCSGEYDKQRKVIANQVQTLLLMDR